MSKEHTSYLELLQKDHTVNSLAHKALIKIANGTAVLNKKSIPTKIKFHGEPKATHCPLPPLPTTGTTCFGTAPS